MRIAIAKTQVPFIYGGAELLAQGLLDALRGAGHTADIVSLPFRYFPESEILRAIDLWESEDLTKLNYYEPDQVICLNFPAFYLQHPKKYSWILHQFRSAYDLYRLDDDQKISDKTRTLINEKDTEYFGQCQKLFTLSHTVANRLIHYNGLKAEPLYHPPPYAELYYSASQQSYIFAPSRLEALKRQDLLIEAMRYVQSPTYVIISGVGGQYARLKKMVQDYKLDSQIRFLGHISLTELRSFYANALAVFFGPFDEDYGYVTLEAMLSAKPIITCKDSGGPLEFIADQHEGLVVDPDPKAIAEAIDHLATQPKWAIEMGINGRKKYHTLNLSWNDVVTTLLS